MTESKVEWKAAYKAFKVKENTVFSNIMQTFKKFQTHYEEFENLSIIYGGMAFVDPDNMASNLKIDQYADQIEKLELQRKSERLSIYARFQSVTAAIHKLKAMIESFQRDPSDSKLKTIERLGNEIDSDLVEFKHSERQVMESLNAEEKLLERDLNVFVERINLLEKQMDQEPENTPIVDEAKKIRRSNKLSNKEQPSGGDIPPEIEEFNRFVATNGGPYGGWDQEDHQAFLAIKAKAGSNKQFLFTEVAKRVPGQTPFTVQQHLTWYSQFSDLKKKKQAAITQWREEREKKRVELVNQREEEELKELEKQDEIARKQWQMEQRRKKEKIEEWRRKKMEEKKRHDEELLRKQTEERLQQQLKEQEHQQKKMLLQHLKQEKEANEREKQIVEQLQSKPRPMSARDRQRLEERNKLYAERRQSLASRQAREREIREERLQKMIDAVHVEGKSDSSRLTSETAAHRSRILDLRQHGAENKGSHNFNIRQVQHRAMPSWRRGV